jgi:hypothetical protein
MARQGVPTAGDALVLDLLAVVSAFTWFLRHLMLVMVSVQLFVVHPATMVPVPPLGQVSVKVMTVPTLNPAPGGPVGP